MLLGAMVRGAESNTGVQFIDTLLSTGGINEMLETISIILLVMAYAGIMQHCGLMASMVEPIVRRLQEFCGACRRNRVLGRAVQRFCPTNIRRSRCRRWSTATDHNRRGVDRAAWGQYREFLGGHYVSACAVEHVCYLHGYHSGRFLRRLHGVCLLLLFVPNRRFRCGALFGKKLGWVSKGELRLAARDAEAPEGVPREA